VRPVECTDRDQGMLPDLTRPAATGPSSRGNLLVPVRRPATGPGQASAIWVKNRSASCCSWKNTRMLDSRPLRSDSTRYRVYPR